MRRGLARREAVQVCALAGGEIPSIDTSRCGYNAAMRTYDIRLAQLEAPGKPWGLAATFGLSVVVWYTLELLQAAMGAGIEAVLHDLQLVTPEQNTQALHFAVITCVSTALCGALVIAAARLRVGLDFRQYLGIRAIPPREWLRWMLVTLVIVAQMDLVLYLVKGELLPVQWVEIYRSVHSPWLFWIALIVATPVFEELIYRGFLFEGIRASRLGGIGAVMITTLIWSLVHQEYDPLEFAMIFMFGLVLGMARLRTGSILLTMGLHMLHNLIASGEILWLAAMTE